MTREAALLGTATYSIFSGSQAAVDALLGQRGLLTHLRDPERLPAGGGGAARGRRGRRDRRRPGGDRSGWSGCGSSGERIIERFVAATLGRVPRPAGDG